MHIYIPLDINSCDWGVSVLVLVALDQHLTIVRFGFYQMYGLYLKFKSTLQGRKSIFCQEY